MFFEKEFFRALGLHIPQDKLQLFKSLLYQENRNLNLTRVPEEDFYIRHIIDSLLLFPFISFLSSKINAKTVLDFGTGGGFPGVPLALAMPNISFYLFDKSPKKIKYLQRLVKALDIKNVVIGTSPDVYRMIVSRAVAPLDELLRLTAPHLRCQGIGLAIKGDKIFEEIKSLSQEVYLQVFGHTFENLPLNSKIVVYSFGLDIRSFEWQIPGFNLLRLPNLSSTQKEES